MDKAARGRIMASVRSVSHLELNARRAAGALAGCRLRHNASGRGADWVNKRRKVAVFVNGCFWHGCPEHFRIPKTNVGFWMEKISRNVKRDRTTVEMLENKGFTVYVLWEHNLRKK